jgi:dTDP-L-rhamnose 4-epimerase
MTNDKVLITGGLGFIGLETARVLVEEGRQVLLLDNLSPQIHGAVPNLSSWALLSHPRVEIVRADVHEPGVWAKTLVDVSGIVHLAAETGTGQSMYEISRYTETNVGGTASLLDYLANHKHNVTKVILASSRSVYGEGAYMCERCGLVHPSMRSEAMFRMRQWEPWCPKCRGAISATATPESAETTPASIYAATKLAQEHLVRIAAQALGIPAVIFRFQNVYGEGQSLKNPYTGILSIFSNQLRQGRTINLYEDAQESRDFVHVSDVVRAVVLGLLSEAGNGCTLNVGAGYPTTVARIALLLKERLGGENQIVVSGQYRLGDIRHGYADMSAIRAKLGFVPEVSLEQGLDRFVAWVRTQPVEPDRLSTATQELLARGLMDGHVESEAATV